MITEQQSISNKIELLFWFFRLLFFIRRNTDSKKIYKCTLDGTNLFIVTEINDGVADVLIIDQKENTIYWTNVGDNLVERIDFDGNYHETYTSPRAYPFIIKLVSTCFVRIRIRVRFVIILSRRVVSFVSER